MTNTERIELLRELCLAFGPTGCEERIADTIVEKITFLGYNSYIDRLGNVIIHIPSKNKNAKKLMVSAHMDEVGFIINEITDDGYLKFATLGGIDARVLCGKHVIVEGHDNKLIPGIISSKAIHHQTSDERKNITPIKNMYIDIGAINKDNALELTDIGNSATFDSEFILFGNNKGFIKGKAIDDRLGCANMLYVLSKLDKAKASAELDIWFCFTVREEIGLSGAQTAAQKIAPDYSIVLESTAVADLPDVTENRRVAELGNGGAISLRDRSTIYDRGFIRFALALAETKHIPVQIKKYVSGGNDAGHIHKSGVGVKSLAISAPSRYIHSPACVISTEDYLSIGELLYAIITDFNIKEIENA